MRYIQLTQNQVSIIDDEDFNTVSQYKWCAKKHKNGFYAVRSVYKNGIKTTEYLHKFLLKNEFGIIDHIDRNGLNNTRGNLRVVSFSENGMNRNPNKNHSSKYKGVCFNKREKKFFAKIYKGKNQIHLGYFMDEKDAAIAYNKAAMSLFKEYANINIIT